MFLTLALTALIAQGHALPHFVKQWEVPTYLGITQLARLGNEIYSNKGKLDIATGKLTASIVNLGDAEFLIPRDLNWYWGSTEPSVFWSGNGRRLAFRGKELEILEFKEGSTAVARSIKLRNGRGTILWSAVPNMGIFLFSSIYTGMAVEQWTDELIVRPLAPTPLPFTHYYDISRPKQGVLGVRVPIGKTYEDILHMRNTPLSPLSCGDPFTGQVRWTAKGYSNGCWVGSHYVLAQKPWALLDGFSGKKLNIDMSMFASIRSTYMVAALEDNVVIQWDDNHIWKTSCFHLEFPQTSLQR